MPACYHNTNNNTKRNTLNTTNKSCGSLTSICHNLTISHELSQLYDFDKLISRNVAHIYLIYILSEKTDIGNQPGFRYMLSFIFQIRKWVPIYTSLGTMPCSILEYKISIRIHIFGLMHFSFLKPTIKSIPALVN